ncbi:MAG: phosphate signaling complex protein PhoU [Rhodospirillales bacterium]
MASEGVEHIVKAYDAELARLDQYIAEMGGLAEMQLAGAIDALLRRDVEKAESVVKGDKRLDALENEIEVFAVQMIARRQPVAEDLRTIISALRTAAVIERIGDYAKNIAKRTVALAQTPPLGPVRTIGRMGGLVQDMMKQVLDAYTGRDADKAEDVRRRDQEVDVMHTSLFRELLTYMMEDPHSITGCTHLLFCAKNVERIGDHVTSIAENLIFLTSGAHPDEDRPKDDGASYAVVEPGAGDNWRRSDGAARVLDSGIVETIPDLGFCTGTARD